MSLPLLLNVNQEAEKYINAFATMPRNYVGYGGAMPTGLAGLGGVVDDAKAVLLAATDPIQQKVSNLDLAIKLILGFSGVSALCGLYLVFKGRRS